MLNNAQLLTEKARGAGVTIMHAPIAFSPGYNEITKHPYGILKGVVDGKSVCSKASGGRRSATNSNPPLATLWLKANEGLDTFASTNLDFILRSKGITTVIIGGFLTNCCVESTMRTAYENGYEVITVTDMVAATSEEEHANALKYDFPMFSKPMPPVMCLLRLVIVARKAKKILRRLAVKN